MRAKSKNAYALNSASLVTTALIGQFTVQDYVLLIVPEPANGCEILTVTT